MRRHLVPKTSPFVVGPYKTGLAILGETAGTTALPQPFTLADVGQYAVCRDGKAVSLTALPSRVLAAVYYPLTTRTPRPDTPIKISDGGPFPILLYAHALRVPLDSTCAPPAGSPLTDGYYRMERDFTSVDFMLRHVASYGCVAVAADLSWLAFSLMEGAFEQRATVLLRYYNYLRLANGALFANRLDLSRVVLAGHSTGGGACLVARRQFAAAGFPAPVAMGLVAPETNSSFIDITSWAAEQAPNGLMVLEGTRDTSQSAESARVYAAGRSPKALVTIPGANHFGYTELCTLENICAAGDPQGTISRDGQQRTGAAYLAALVRYFALNDASARPYLAGERAVEGLELFGVTGIQVQAEGFGS